MQLKWHIADDGWLVLAIFGLVTIVLGMIAVPLGMFALGLMVWLAYILRVPIRQAPTDPAAIVAPADGRIVAIEPFTFAGKPATRVTIKTSIVDAHLQVAPVSGRINDNFLMPGLFLPLDDLDAMRSDNERREISIEIVPGMVLQIIQYGSKYARQLVCHVGEGKHIDRGVPLGMIRMAGVTDIIIPAQFTLCAGERQNILAGETVLATPVNRR